jgi:type IV secretory pathway VirB4 component
MKYRNFKVLAYDRLRGLEVFTRFHDGSYLDFTHDPEVCPWQLDDTAVNRAFLQNFLQTITGAASNRDQEIIGDAIRQLYDFEKHERTLVNLKDAFGRNEEGSMREALNKWLPGGPFGSYFTGNRDALDFTRPLVTFDMTHLLDLPEALWPMTMYLFHKLFLTRKGDGYMVFIDELPKYLRSKEFVPKVEVLLEEIRKTNGVFVGAVQEAGAVLEHDILASKFRNNISTWVLFPEPLAKAEHYIDILRLTDREFEWIKKPHVRKVMVKRKGGESVILDCDLSPLGSYLNVFNSSTRATERLKTLRAEYPNDWKARYLAEGD